MHWVAWLACTMVTVSVCTVRQCAWRQLRARLAVFRMKRRAHWYALMYESYQHVMVGMNNIHRKRIRMKLKCAPSHVLLAAAYPSVAHGRCWLLQAKAKAAKAHTQVQASALATTTANEGRVAAVPREETGYHNQACHGACGHAGTVPHAHAA